MSRAKAAHGMASGFAIRYSVGNQENDHMSQSGKIQKIVEENRRRQVPDKKCKRILSALFLWPQAAKTCVALGVAAASAVSAWGFPVEIQGIDTVEGGVTLVYEVDGLSEFSDDSKSAVSAVMQEFVDDVLNRFSVHSFLPSRSRYEDMRQNIISHLGNGMAMRRFITRELNWKEGVDGTMIQEERIRESEFGEDGGEASRSVKTTFIARETTAPRLRKVTLVAVKPAGNADALSFYQALDDELESILNSVSTLVPSLQDQERNSLERYKKERAVGRIGAGADLPKIRQAKKEAMNLRTIVRDQRSRLKSVFSTDKQCNMLGIIRDILKAKDKLNTLRQTKASARWSY